MRVKNYIFDWPSKQHTATSSMQTITDFSSFIAYFLVFQNWLLLFALTNIFNAFACRNVTMPDCCQWNIRSNISFSEWSPFGGGLISIAVLIAQIEAVVDEYLFVGTTSAVSAFAINVFHSHNFWLLIRILFCFFFYYPTLSSFRNQFYFGVRNAIWMSYIVQNY